MSNMESLERLFLSDNLLTSLPFEMDDLVSREIVTMSGNPLSGNQHQHEGHTH
jgi:Leucine-rich repeat (LRR) protein